MSRALALIVDDEPDIRELLEITLARMDVDSRSAATLAEAKDLLASQAFDLCLADMRLPDGSGLDLVALINHDHPRLPVAVITAHGNMALAIQALKAGAFDFVAKPVDLPVLRDLVETALKLNRGSGVPEAGDADAASGGELLGESQPMQAIRRMIDKLARSQAPVYVSGESGTGKELAARRIHARGPRADGPFVAVNCGAIPHELMESELFGHVKGSFTGAVKDKQGLFQAADGGTLFLDEVADLPLSLQVKLLRAIQEKAVRPVGAAAEEHIDTRIISATHKDLARMVQAEVFRQDLFYRLNVIELRMPPLRERRGDLPLLIRHILDRSAAESGQPPPTLSNEAMDTLRQYAFPGNVRELENILERAATLCEGGVIQTSDLGLAWHPPADNECTTAGPDGGLEQQLADMERRLISRALEQTGGNKTAAARQLGISFRALRYRLEKLGLAEDAAQEEDKGDAERQ